MEKLSNKQAKEIFESIKKILKLGNDKLAIQKDKSLKNNVESLVIKILTKYPEVATIRDKEGRNVGMLAAMYNYENIVLKVLDSEEASTQQDIYGCNIAILSASRKLERAVLKALDNEKASVQQDDYGWNAGMVSAMYKLPNATKKALKNKEACEQMDFKGQTILQKARKFLSESEINEAICQF